MFANCQNLTNIGDTSIPRVQTTYAMFFNCFNLVEAPSLYSTNNIKNMSRMFENCKKLNDIPNYYTTNVTDMRRNVL